MTISSRGALDGMQRVGRLAARTHGWLGAQVAPLTAARRLAHATRAAFSAALGVGGPGTPVGLTALSAATT